MAAEVGHGTRAATVSSRAWLGDVQDAEDAEDAGDAEADPEDAEDAEDVSDRLRPNG
jgi:hypothetical protein